MASLQKNVASQNFAFSLITASSGAASTTTSTSSLTAFVTKDGVQASAGGTFSYLGTGEWNYAPTQAETNCTNFALYVTATSNIPFHGTAWTDTVDSSGRLSVNVAGWNATTVSSLPTNFSVLSIDAGGNVAITSNVKRNAALTGFEYVLTDSTSHAPKTGATGLSALISKDGAAPVTCANSPTESGNGVYTINLQASELNCVNVMLILTGSGCDMTFAGFITQP